MTFTMTILCTMTLSIMILIIDTHKILPLNMATFSILTLISTTLNEDNSLWHFNLNIWRHDTQHTNTQYYTFSIMTFSIMK